MDLYFESGGDVLLSLDEMLGGADLDPLCCVGGGGTGGGGGDSPWEDWSGPPLSLDLSGDPPHGIMVNPNTVIPSIKPSSQQPPPQPQHHPEPQVKKELVVKKEEEVEMFEGGVEESEEEEEDEDEEEEAEDEEEDEVVVKVEEDEDEEEEASSNSRDLWTTLVMKPVRTKGGVGHHQLQSSQHQAASPVDPHGGRPRFAQYQIKRSPAVQVHSPAVKTSANGGLVSLKHQQSHHNHHGPANGHHHSKKETGGGRLSAAGLGGGHEYPKPAYSYSCLIAMALKNSTTGSLPVSEIYNFMCEHFPYFKSAPAGWKNSVRHNLSLNKCFEKIEKGMGAGGDGGGGSQRKGCLWAMNPSKVGKMDDEVAKWSRKDPMAIRRAMRFPETLERLERGDMKIGGSTLRIKRERVEEEEEDEEEEEEDEEEEDVEDEEVSSNRSLSDDDPGSEDEGEVPPSLKPFDSRLNSSLIIAADNNIANDLGVEFSEEMYEELGLLQQVLTSSGANGEDDLADLFATTPSKRPRLECVVASPIRRTAIASHP